MTATRNHGRFRVSGASLALRHDFFRSDPAGAWLAGLLAADGCISPDLHRWALSQSGDAGLALIEQVRALVHHTGKVSATQPPSGQTSYSISAGSPEMVHDLTRLYGVTPRKTLTYRWPSTLGEDQAATFLRGYVDGDGCVAIYPTPQGSPSLHLSFVGTSAFVQAAASIVPATGCVRKVARCRDLSEARYSGRHAWDAATWLYADASLYPSKKYLTFRSYVLQAELAPPSWMVNRQRRRAVLDLLAAGASLRETSRVTGVPLGTVCRWKSLVKNSDQEARA